MERGELRIEISWRNLNERDQLEEVGEKCQDNIKIYLQDVGLEGVGGMSMAQDRDKWRDVVKTVINLRGT
jgi:hypothetical protein